MDSMKLYCLGISSIIQAGVFCFQSQKLVACKQQGESPEVFKSPTSFRNPLTYGKSDHGFIRVRGELHPIHYGSDGIERFVGHL